MLGEQAWAIGRKRRRDVGSSIDWKGVKFGNLVATRPVGKDRAGSYVWELVCTRCGKKATANQQTMHRGMVGRCPHCEVVHGYDLIGQEKGMLSVVAPAGLNKKRQRLWIVRCSICGKKSTVTASKFVHSDHPKCPICGA